MKHQKNDKMHRAGRISPRRQHALDPPVLRLDPLAWLKLVYLCHAGRTEVGCFGISRSDDLLYVEQLSMPLQSTTAASVEFSDEAVADHFDRFADQGVSPGRCGRIWLHTHPGDSPNPSCVDETTFDRVFGPCDWAVMFILSRTGRTYARLRFNAGPGGQVVLPVAVDWPAWPDVLNEQGPDLSHLVRQWEHEYRATVIDVSLRPVDLMHGSDRLRTPDGWDLSEVDPAAYDTHDYLAEQYLAKQYIDERSVVEQMAQLPARAGEVSHDG